MEARSDGKVTKRRTKSAACTALRKYDSSPIIQIILTLFLSRNYALNELFIDSSNQQNMRQMHQTVFRFSIPCNELFRAYGQSRAEAEAEADNASFPIGLCEMHFLFDVVTLRVVVRGGLTPSRLSHKLLQWILSFVE